MTPERPDQLTAAAIARLAGVGRAAVSNWRRRYPNFPKPTGGSPTSPTFERTEVEAWLKSTGKGDQLVTVGQTETGTQRITEPDRSLTSLGPRDFLARCMAALLPREITEIDDPVVLDPACGTGTALLAVADRFGENIRLAGQEINTEYAQAAQRNLSEADAPYEVHTGDSLLDNQLTQYLGKAAAVVCEPPFDSPGWPEAELTTDPRWEFGIPAPRDGELAWVQHCYAHLRPRGVAVVAVSRRTCVQPSGESIRAALIRSGALRAVIALPSGMSSVPGTDVCLWILRRTADHAPIQMLDLADADEPADVPREFAAWQRLLADARQVPRLDLLDGHSAVLPSRYVSRAPAVTSHDLSDITTRLTALYTRIGRGLPAYGSPVHRVKTSRVTVAELERVGALAILPRDTTPRAGDIVLRTLGRPPMVVSPGADDTSGIAQVVEIDETRLDPYFVATFLRTEMAGLPVANTLGAASREDLRRCGIPRMPLAEQRRYGVEFRRLQELDAALARLAGLSGKVIDQVIRGLTSGVLAPDIKGEVE